MAHEASENSGDGFQIDATLSASNPVNDRSLPVLTEDKSQATQLPPSGQPSRSHNEEKAAKTLSWADGVEDPEADAQRVEEMLEEMRAKHGHLSASKGPTAPFSTQVAQSLPLVDRVVSTRRILIQNFARF
ncbi:MAG: hypothetical protein Q9225_005418 [Loekoesia sp. 1 TL-2023]